MDYSGDNLNYMGPDEVMGARSSDPMGLTCHVKVGGKEKEGCRLAVWVGASWNLNIGTVRKKRCIDDFVTRRNITN